MGRSHSHCEGSAAPRALCRSATALHAARHAIPQPPLSPFAPSLLPRVRSSSEVLSLSFVHMLFSLPAQFLSPIPTGNISHSPQQPGQPRRADGLTLRSGPSDMGFCGVGSGTGRAARGAMNCLSVEPHCSPPPSFARSFALFHFPLPTKSRPRPGKCAAGLRVEPLTRGFEPGRQFVFSARTERPRGRGTLALNNTMRTTTTTTTTKLLEISVIDLHHSCSA